MGGRSRVKRKAVQSEDGWTVITHGMGGMSLSSTEDEDTVNDKGKGNDMGKEQNKGKDTGKIKTGSLPGVVEGMSVASLTADFEARRGKWTDTETARQVRDMLGRKRWSVDKAACIGIGSFSRDWEHRHRCMWQLVLFVWVVEIRKFNLFSISRTCQLPTANWYT
jgi:hypothetical protein